jgi:ubiquitin C-terminal hydrolase
MFTELTISIPQTSKSSVTLEDCLELDRQPTTCDYFCHVCKTDTTHSYQLAIYRLGKVLTVHLKRFLDNAQKKVDTRVKYRLTNFDVDKWIVATDGAGKGCSRYNLAAVL